MSSPETRRSFSPATSSVLSISARAKPVAEVIYPVVINRHEIPGLVFENPGGSVVDGTILGKNLGEGLEAPVLLLINLGGAWNPGEDRSFRHLRGMHAQGSKGGSV